MSDYLRPLSLSFIMMLTLTGVWGCTKEASNTADRAEGTALVINEIVAKASNDGADWIEFYNAGNESVLLSDYYIMDDNGYREKASLPDRVLAPDEFFVVRADSDASENGLYHVPFKLGADDSLTLYKGNIVVDSLDWNDGDAPEGSSFGRFPDGDGEEMTLSPTPGEENE